MARRARELDPVSLIVNTHVAHHYYWARQHARAKKQFWKTLELNPHFPPARFGLGWNHLVEGEVGEAQEHFQWGVQSGGRYQHAVAALACAHAAAGQSEQATSALDELLQAKATDDVYVSSREIALVYRWLGDADHALEWLERAYEERAAWLCFLDVDPVWDALREQPGFRAITDRMGFPPRRAG